MPEDFFKSLRIKKLRKLAGGDTYTIIYLKLQLLSLNSEGVLQYKGIEKTFEEEIALEIDEDVENVIVTMNYLRSCGLLEIIDESHQILPWVIENTGSETASTIRSRKSRAVASVLQCNTDATLPQHECNGEIRDKSREIRDENDLSISDEIDCSTDVQRVVTAWNAIDGLPKITRLDPDSNRGKMLGARIKAYGIDKVLGAIESIPHSSFLMGKTKKQFRLTFDWFVKPNNFPKVLDGNYLDENKAAYAQDSDPYRGARMLARKLRERLPSLPECPEETLQKWAAVMDELNSDGHDWDEISDVLSFSQKSAFWQRQICDAYALRKKYVNILADMDKG
jgi:predicted phage replisome organizer